MLMQEHPPRLRPGLTIHQKDCKKAGYLHPLFLFSTHPLLILSASGQKYLHIRQRCRWGVPTLRQYDNVINVSPITYWWEIPV